MSTMLAPSSFIPLQILAGCALGMHIIESTFSMILLADTGLECNFVSFYQSFVAGGVLAAAFIFTWLSGLITDRTAPYAIRVMQLSILLCFIFDFIMAFFGSYSEWLLVVILAFRYGVIIQLSLSVNKVLKLHLVYHKIEDGEQVQIFNEFAMFSQTSGRVFAAVSGFVVPYLLITYAENFTFKALKYGLISICFIFDVVSFICSYIIPTDFIPGARNLPVDIGDANGEKGREASYDVYDGDIGLTSLLESDNDDRSPAKSKQPDIIAEMKTSHSKKLEKESLGSDLPYLSPPTSPSSGKSERAGAIASSSTSSWTSYMPSIFRRTVNIYAKTKLIWIISIQIACISFVVGFIAIIFRFDQASYAIPVANLTRDTFCGDLIPTLILQNIFMEAFIQVATIVYSVVLVKMRPYYFFGRVFFLLQLVIILATTVLSLFNLSPVWGSFVLGICSGITYILSSYLDSIFSSIIPADIFGYIYAFQKSMNLFILLVSAAISFLKLSALLNYSILISVCVFSFCFGSLLVYFNKKAILALDKKVSHSNFNCFQRFMTTWIYGYPNDKVH